MKYCNCFKVLTIKEAYNGIKDEVLEFIEEPTKDELSDIMFSLNRLLGSYSGKPYVKVLPFTGLHTSKINERMGAYGCIRSKRHLKDGKCPSTK